MFFATLVFLILWPSRFLSTPIQNERLEIADSKGNRNRFYAHRIWIGLNALVGIVFVGIVLGEADALDILLNSGYAQPFQIAVRKVIVTWAITILTVGSLFLSVKFWWTRHWSILVKGWFSVHALVSLYCVFCLKHLGLLFFFY